MAQNKKTSTIMFYEICRLCLEERGHCNIFDRDGLSEDIHSCTGVKVLLADNLPQKICKHCLDIVTMASRLSIVAKRNEGHLLELFSDEETENTKVQTPKKSVEPVSSASCKKKASCQEKNSVSKQFLSVRSDLFESQVSEESILPNKSPERQPDSSQKPEIIKRCRDDANTEYKCSVCSKTFDKWKKLYHHNRLHTKNYPCPMDVCAKKFSTKADLQKHIRTHTGEKPYQCDVCAKCFAQRGTLKGHKETVHGTI